MGPSGYCYWEALALGWALWGWWSFLFVYLFIVGRVWPPGSFLRLPGDTLSLCPHSPHAPRNWLALPPCSLPGQLIDGPPAPRSLLLASVKGWRISQQAFSSSFCYHPRMFTPCQDSTVIVMLPLNFIFELAEGRGMVCGDKGCISHTNLGQW